jgi:hypothetical protein
MKRNSSLCFFVSISVSKSLAPFTVEVRSGESRLAKTNREQSLIVHALFGKWILRSLEHAGGNRGPELFVFGEGFGAVQGLNVPVFRLARAFAGPSGSPQA